MRFVIEEDGVLAQVGHPLLLRSGSATSCQTVTTADVDESGVSGMGQGMSYDGLLIYGRCIILYYRCVRYDVQL